MKTIAALIACLCIFEFSGCAALSGFDRSYSLSYQDEQGRKIGGSVSLHPIGGGK